MSPGSMQKQPKAILMAVLSDCIPNFNSYKVKSNAKISFHFNFLSNEAMMLSSKFIYLIPTRGISPRII